VKEQRLVGATLALLLMIVSAGCGNRNGSLVGYRPEGQVNAGIMVVQVDTTAGALKATATVYMRSPTDRVRLFDNVNAKGFVPNDAINEPVRVLSSGWGVYNIPLSPYDPAADHVLLARGSRDTGPESVLSPLSNPATIPAGSLELVAPRDTLPLAPRAPVIHADAAPEVKIDSLYFNVAAVAGAQSIYLEVVKGAVTQYLALFQRQANGTFAQTSVFENIPPALGQTYLWHVDEYDIGSRLIAATSVTGSFVVKPPKVSGAPIIWPTTPDHFIFVDNWTIPGFIARLRPAH